MTIIGLRPDHADALSQFFAELPAGDLTFIEEDVTDPAQVRSLAAMFTALGFTGEALLRDHIRDRDGRLRDLIVLAHYVDETWAAMATVGLQEEMDA